MNSARLRLVVSRYCSNFMAYAVHYVCAFQGDELSFPLAVESIKRQIQLLARCIRVEHPKFSNKMQAFSRILSLEGKEIVRKASLWKLRYPPLH